MECEYDKRKKCDSLYIERNNKLLKEIERLKEELTILVKDDERNQETIINLGKENEKLKSIIKELEEILEYEKNDYGGNIDIETHNIDSEFLRGNSWEADYILDKLQELKGSDKE